MSALEELEARRRVDRDRRSRRRGAQGKISAATYAAKIEGKPCRVCDEIIGWGGLSLGSIEAHHVVPKSKWPKHALGLHDAANLIPLCHGHHQAHHTGGIEQRVPRALLTPEEFANALRMTSPAWVDAWYPEVVE